MKFFSRNIIDSIGQIDVSSLTYEDLCPHYGTGQAISKGTGRDKSYTYRQGKATNIGDIELSIWISLVKGLIERNGEQELYEKLKEFMREYGFPDVEKSLNKTPLDMFARRIFDDPEWVDYLKFNQKYRPEVVKKSKLVTVVCSCCNKPGSITVEMLNKAVDSVYCPICGRYSEFVVIDQMED